MNQPILFAHRGAKAHAPENTLAAFSKAMELGAGWIELDVHHVDGEFFVIHDDRLDRTTDGTGFLWEHSAAALRSFDAGQGEKIPLLSEVFELTHGRAGLNVELKGSNTGEALAHALSSDLQGLWSPESLIVSSFRHHELHKFHKLLPDVPTAALTMAVPLDLARFAEELEASAIHASIEFIEPDFIADAHARGLKFRVYTVNYPDQLDWMLRLGVDGVFTDDPTLHSLEPK